MHYGCDTVVGKFSQALVKFMILEVGILSQVILLDFRKFGSLQLIAGLSPSGNFSPLEGAMPGLLAKDFQLWKVILYALAANWWGHDQIGGMIWMLNVCSI